jgi:phosphoesterase RecJ-like protein
MTAHGPQATSSEQYVDAGRMILQWQRPVLITHARPDGDALGCLIAMGEILRSLGQEATAVMFEPYPGRYRFMRGANTIRVCESTKDAAFANADGVLILDTCTYNQLDPAATWLKETRVPRIVLDHHLTRDELADVYLVDTAAPAAAWMVFEWARIMGWPMSPAAAEAVFVGIATDTGWFRYDNTTPDCLRAAADLVEAGVELDSIAQRIYQCDPIGTYRLQTAALAGAEFVLDNRLAIITVTRQMLADSGATTADTENLVNGPLVVEQVRASASLVDTGDGIIKCSFRSKGDVDVARLAGRFGGGGHARAAGARISGTIETVKERVLAELKQLGA